MFAVKGTGLQSRGALVPFVSRKTGKEREGDRGHDVLNKYPRLELFPLFNTWICKRDKKNPVLYRPLWKGNLDQWLNNRLSGIIQVCVRWERFLGRCLMAELSCQIESRSVCSNHLEGKASTQSCSKRSLKKRGKGINLSIIVGSCATQSLSFRHWQTSIIFIISYHFWC